MRLSDINIRDPFILYEDKRYYLYGTRAKDFGKKTGGFDVYISDDMMEWAGPVECFNSAKNALNREVNWAPEIHKFNGSYYMFATFTRENGLRGVYVLKSDCPDGEFEPWSDGAVTPDEWECLDGTLYIDKNGVPYLVFCHEHTQIIDGTVCYVQLSGDLKSAVSEPTELFAGSSPYWADRKPAGEHYITDGPFMYRTKENSLLLIWSTFIHHQYCQCVARSDNGEIDGNFIHLPPIITDDGGHGMIFKNDSQLMLTFHTPNTTGDERPIIKRLEDTGNNIRIQE